jgi:hypothetical protein
MAAEEERASSSRSGEKPAVEYTPNEKHEDRASDDENTFDVDAAELPPGYFTSPFFLGTMTGIGLGLMAGVAGFGFAAPILMLINNDIGPVRGSSHDLRSGLEADIPAWLDMSADP